MITFEGIGTQKVESRSSTIQKKNLQKILKFKSNKRKLIKYPILLDPIINKEPLSIGSIPQKTEQSYEKKIKVGSFFLKPKFERKLPQKSNIHLQVLSKQFSFNQIDQTPQKKIQRFKTIADIHPRMHKIKNGYLQNQMEFNQRHMNIHQSLRPNKKRKKLLNYNFFPFKLQANLLCRKINDVHLNNKTQSVESRGQLQQKNTDSSSKYRYKQLQPQEFYYERKGKQLQRHLAERVSKYMSKHVKTISNLPDYEYSKDYS